MLYSNSNNSAQGHNGSLNSWV